jgi:hypothetical protein
VSIVSAGTPEERETARWRLEGGGFAAVGVGGRCWVEASVPKRLTGSNVVPASLDDVRHACAEMYAEACFRVEPHLEDQTLLAGGAPSALTIKRLDIVRDFHGVDRMASILDGLASFPRGRAWTVRRYADAERGNAQTLRIGPRSSWSATLYDKLAEATGRHDGTQLRYELRARSAFLKSKTARKLGRPQLTLGALDLGVLQLLAADRFSAVGYGQPVDGGHRLAQILRDAAVSDRVRRTLVGYLACRSLGIDTGMSSNTERKYRKLAEELGIAASSLGPGDVIDATARLDLLQGVQVLEVGQHDGCDEVLSSDDGGDTD